jgi:hypothetical protein
MADKYGDYEIPSDIAEQKEIAKKNEIEFVKRNAFPTDHEFYSDQITINGRVQNYQRGNVSMTRFFSREMMQHEELGEIPGLFCPDCSAQAFRTDHPKVAVCGDYPGWYFFYRRIDQDIKPSRKLVIKNGELVEDTDQGKEEGSF